MKVKFTNSNTYSYVGKGILIAWTLNCRKWKTKSFSGLDKNEVDVADGENESVLSQPVRTRLCARSRACVHACVRVRARSRASGCALSCECVRALVRVRVRSRACKPAPYPSDGKAEENTQNFSIRMKRIRVYDTGGNRSSEFLATTVYEGVSVHSSVHGSMDVHPWFSITLLLFGLLRATNAVYTALFLVATKRLCMSVCPSGRSVG